jgi:hypothetical protein
MNQPTAKMQQEAKQPQRETYDDYRPENSNQCILLEIGFCALRPHLGKALPKDNEL